MIIQNKTHFTSVLFASFTLSVTLFGRCNKLPVVQVLLSQKLAVFYKKIAFINIASGIKKRNCPGMDECHAMPCIRARIPRTSILFYDFSPLCSLAFRQNLMFAHQGALSSEYSNLGRNSRHERVTTSFLSRRGIFPLADRIAPSKGILSSSSLPASIDYLRSEYSNRASLPDTARTQPQTNPLRVQSTRRVIRIFKRDQK